MAGHEEYGQHSTGPHGKAKYSQETDSEPVAGGKGEKYPEQGNEIGRENKSLQSRVVRKVSRLQPLTTRPVQTLFRVGSVHPCTYPCQ